MSYEDLEEARAKRADKEAAKEAKGKGKRGRKRKSAALEADTPEPNAKVVRMSEALAPTRASVVQMSGTPVRTMESPSGADVLAEDAKDAVRGLEN